MKKRLAEMPLTEKLAIPILRQEGFKNIHWRSLVDWYCCYDFTASKDGNTYLIEVKPAVEAITPEKVMRLKRRSLPALFLIIDEVTKEYCFLPLEIAEEKFVSESGVISIRRKCVMGTDGRTTLPKILREALEIHGKTAFCEIETSGKDAMILTVLSRVGG